MKTNEEVELMQENGRLLAAVLTRVKLQAKPGVSTLQLAEIAREEIEAVGAESAFIGYRGFPGVICISLNEEVVHGIPSATRIMRQGDLVKIDIGIKRKGFYADMAETVYLGEEVPLEIARLLATTKTALITGIRNCIAGETLGKISQSIQKVIETGNLSVVKRFVGHGIGRSLHEKPPVPNFGSSIGGPRLEVGMVLAIEPIATFGSPEIAIKQDGWTAITANGALSAHFEHTVAITSRGPVILTSTCQAG
ncbi:MAG: type I methionyl aminopeptidase [Candidatus Riflebacteria bacterium]|nr:type I methionyl aminopeptidase [Candidatus Riflebacteria bacterium]